MNVAFDNGTAATQRTYTDQQEVVSQHSSSSSNDQLMLDAHDRYRNRSANLHDQEPTSISSSRETGHGAALTNSSLEKNSGSQMIGTSTNFHIHNDVLGESSTASVKSSNYGSPNEREPDTGNLPVSLPQISVSRPANQMIEYPSQQLGTMPRFTCLDPLNNETNIQPQSLATTSRLEALDYLTTQPNHFDYFSSAETQSELMQCYSKDGTNIMPSPLLNGCAIAESPDGQPVPYSSATYQDLHTTLYHHMLETVRNTARTRNASPDPVAQGERTVVHNNAISPSSSIIDDMRSQAREPSLRLQPLKLVKLTKRRQLELWRNYLDEIAVWLDMFDNDRHFQFQIPHLAKSADHLHYSILALSARQMERKSAGKPYTESLALYQEAIQLIVKELYTLDTTVIASCVLLCVLEMMSSSPKAWCRHLDGCAMLLEAAGINGVVGGVRESLFWCFARMDVWGGYLEDTLTKIPTSRWFIPSGSMMEAVTYLKAGSGSHSHANYAVFLCASVVNVISNKSGADVGQAEGDSARRGTYTARWQALFDLLEDWYNNRTEEMQPLMTFASGSDESRDPFSTILYGSSPAINGNQLYHAAALLLLQHKPKGLRLAKSPRSILWHARQICGIAVSNSDHGALINCLQPLWIAGKLMSHESEHSAILDLLAQIEKDTGWATAWRAEDLKDYWGDVGYSDTQ